ELPSILQKLNIDLITLAGYLKKIPDEICSLYTNRMINIHPALLPAFGGKGMYGMNVHKAVFDSSAKVSGATVHFVNEVYDSGAIIMQKCVDISGVTSPEEIAEKVLKVEHEIFPAAILKLADNKVKIKNNRVYLID
ncbi:MAG TPA: formyltransferase family protein, partial [Ignavibacteriales bacterium]|nr:formyltransferase family protein [Ignavibacteriales bacterium]